MSRPNLPLSRERALRAALAVTLGGVAACGTDDSAGTGGDVGSSDVQGDSTTADVTPTDTVTIDAAVDTQCCDAQDLGSDDSSPDADAVDDDTVVNDVGPDADTDPADVIDDIAEDTVNADTTSDATDADAADGSGDVDENLPCKVDTDGVCPDHCSELDDFDCCTDYCGGPGWASYDPVGMMCYCAVEGPFAPPSFDRARARLRQP